MLVNDVITKTSPRVVERLKVILAKNWIVEATCDDETQP